MDNSCGAIKMLRFLTNEEKEKEQKRGYMCEHLLCLHSMTSKRTALYNNNFPVYLSGYGEADIILFGLMDGKEDKLSCVLELLKLPIKELNIVSPSALNGIVNIKTRYVDFDYHIDVNQFDLDLKGRKYKNIRYSMKKADKKGYRIRFGREFTWSHAYILSRHMAHHTLNLWDFEELLSLERFFREHNHCLMLEAYYEDKLMGFDVVDFFEENRIMAVPLEICLEKPSLADFLMLENLKYAKDNGYKRLDIGLACGNTGLQDFKKKWLAEPKYKLFVQTIEISR